MSKLGVIFYSMIPYGSLTMDLACGGSEGDNYASNMQICPPPPPTPPMFHAYMSRHCETLLLDGRLSLHLPWMTMSLPFLYNCISLWWLKTSLHHAFHIWISSLNSSGIVHIDPAFLSSQDPSSILFIQRGLLKSDNIVKPTCLENKHKNEKITNMFHQISPFSRCGNPLLLPSSWVKLSNGFSASTILLP